MIIRARRVLTMDGGPIADGAVQVRGGTIEAVGEFNEISTHDDDVIDLGDSLLLPGLINAHCHLDYTAMRGLLPRADSFTSWIHAINAQKARWTDGDYLRSIREGLDEAADYGTTTIANLEAFPALIEQVGEAAMRVFWFAEMIDVRGAVAFSEKCHPAPHAPFTASLALYREAAALAKEGRLCATTHLAESAEEMAMFRDGAGPLYEFLRGLGRPMDDCGIGTPLAHLLNAGVLDERWLVAHLNELTEADFRLLAAAPRFQIVHCPRSHAYFGHTRFAYERVRELGFSVALGTDSLASNEDLSLFAEMRQFSEKYPATEPREIVEMVTTSAAKALGMGRLLGKIAPGFEADMIAIPLVGNVGDELKKVIEFSGRVAWRMLHGKVDSPR